jgi:hypothetical protein
LVLRLALFLTLKVIHQALASLLLQLILVSFRVNDSQKELKQLLMLFLSSPQQGCQGIRGWKKENCATARKA